MSHSGWVWRALGGTASMRAGALLLLCCGSEPIVGGCTPTDPDMHARLSRRTAALAATVQLGPETALIRGEVGRWPALAVGPTVHLASWSDRQTTVGTSAGSTAYIDTLRVSRVLPDGTPLEPTGIVVASYYGNGLLGGAAHAAWMGDRFLLVWHVVGGGYTNPLHATTVMADGTVGTTLDVAPGGYYKGANALASGGSTAVLVWTDSNPQITPTNLVHATQLSNTGAVLSDNIVDMATAGKDPQLCWNGSGYLLAWSANGQILGARLSATGAPIDTAPISISPPGAASSPAVAWIAPWFLVGWTDATKGADTDVFAARVDSNGAVQDASSIPIRTSTAAETLRSLSASPQSFLVTSTDASGKLFGTRVGSNGSVLGSSVVRPAGSAATAAAWDGTHHFLVYENAGGFGVQAAFVGDDGSVAQPSAFDVGIRWNTVGVSAAWGGSTFFAVTGFRELFYGSFSNPKDSALATRFGTSGVATDPHGTVIGTSLTSLLWNGSDFVFGLTTRVALDGTTVKNSSTPAGGNGPLASDGQKILSFTCPTTCTAYYGQFLDASLAPVGSPFSIGTTAPVFVAWDGTQYVLLQNDAVTSQVVAKSLTSDGTLQTTTTLGHSGRVVGGFAADLFVWQSSTDVHFELRNRQLAVVVPEATLATGGTLRSATWDGSQFIVLYSDTQNILAARISESGAVLDPGGFVVAPASAGAVDLASGTDGTTAFVYTAPDPSSTGTTNVYARLLVTGSVIDGGAGTDGGGAGGTTNSEAGPIDASTNADAGSLDGSTFSDAGGLDGAVASDSATRDASGIDGTATDSASGGSASGDASSGSGGTAAIAGASGVSGGGAGVGGAQDAASAGSTGIAGSGGGSVSGAGGTASGGAAAGIGGLDAGIAGGSSGSSGFAGIGMSTDAQIGDARAPSTRPPNMDVGGSGFCAISLSRTSPRGLFGSYLVALGLVLRRRSRQR